MTARNPRSFPPTDTDTTSWACFEFLLTYGCKGCRARCDPCIDGMDPKVPCQCLPLTLPSSTLPKPSNLRFA